MFIINIGHIYSCFLFYFLLFDLIPYFEKNRWRLMSLPCCLYVFESLCMSVYPPILFSFSMLSVSYQTAVGDYFFPEFLVHFFSKIERREDAWSPSLAPIYNLKISWCQSKTVNVKLHAYL
jgi:hypothetical protein